MNTVTFGTASAPYLAIKFLKKVADDEHHNFPEGAKVIREDMYVDDLIRSADSIEESMKAFGSAVYVRVLDSEGKIHTNLLLAKTKVAPSQRTITLPRLELCGAVLLAQLLQYTKEVLGMPDIKMYAWTDSTIAMAWIRAMPAK
ncbi:uncharacterized protein LOC129907602 [Episyrphus balteatus]|uniref:uncharacterized protein LOC129907602 n=1 Tax=Episyrphus balteatus TaxID=286459 RepID=UPI0024869208|nr:uncharacterized protein LOC129907602 [Episyrphus balteatus]